MDIHPLLNKYAVTTKDKLNPLPFKREQSKTCGKSHPLISKATVTTAYGYPSTAY